MIDLQIADLLYSFGLLTAPALSLYFIRSIENQEQARPAHTIQIILISVAIASFCFFAHAFAEISPLFIPALAVCAALVTVDAFTTLLPLRLQAATFVLALAAALATFTQQDWFIRAIAILAVIAFYASFRLYTTLRGKSFGMGYGDFILMPSLLLLADLRQPIEFIVGIAFFGGIAQLFFYITRYSFLFSPMTEDATTTGAEPFGPPMLLGSQFLAFGLMI